MELLAQLLRSWAAGLPLPSDNMKPSKPFATITFPGNVRELENALTRAVALVTNGPISAIVCRRILLKSIKNRPLDRRPHGNRSDWPS